MCMRSMIAVAAVGFAMGLAAVGQKPQYPDYPSETPEHFQAPTQGMDYERREVMIPMRDGVKLHTVILLLKGVPKGAAHAGILMTRTPYSADAQTMTSKSAELAPGVCVSGATTTRWKRSSSGGYIRVVQDIRGKYGSEGDYVMNRPMHGPLNPTPVDESSDTYDTIDWLVKNVLELNGKGCGIVASAMTGF